MDAISPLSHPVRMAKKAQKQRHFIRAWRKHRGLTLEQLAARIESTHATLSRIERGKLPYSQPLLEALADALGCEPADLIMRDPTQPDAIWTILDQIAPVDRPRAIQVLQAFRRTGTDG